LTRGGAALESYKTELQRQTVGPHNTWRIKPPGKWVKKGKSALNESSLQIVVSIEKAGTSDRLEIGQCLLGKVLR
jgi:hypothetical protein